MENKKVWFITDAAKGLGLTLVKQLLKNGCKVAATASSLNEFDRALLNNEDFFAQAVNLSSAISVEDVIDLAVMRLGRIDVVVNNAGYSLSGSVEELSDHETRANFDINVFGTLNVIRSVMMHLRAQRSGHIFNFSAAGYLPEYTAGQGIHYATGLAVQGITQSLAAEAKEFGINVTLVSPDSSGFNFASPGFLALPRKPITEYAALYRMEDTKCNDGCDFSKIALAIIRSTDEPDAPLNLFLGDDANNMDAVIKDIENRWEYFYQKN